MIAKTFFIFCVACLLVSSAPAAAAPPRALEPLLVDGAGKPIDDREAWAHHRTELLQRWQGLIGPFPQRVPLQTKVLSTEEFEDHSRLLVRYQVDEKYPGFAYILIPKKAAAEGEKRPGVVVMHATTSSTFLAPVGLADREAMHIALHLVRKGYVCIAPKNPFWNMEGKTFQQATDKILAEKAYKTGMAKLTWDAIRATDVLVERPEVDPSRIGCMGHSLGAKEVLYLAAFDERIRATISCEGGIGLSFSNWDAPWYLGQQIKAEGFALDHHELLALVAPRSFMLIGGEKADGAPSQAYIDAAKPVWKLFNAEEKLQLLRHKYGHDFLPPGPEREAVYEWFDRALGAK